MVKIIKKQTEKVSLIADSDITEVVRGIAEKERRSLSAQIMVLVEEALAARGVGLG